MSLLFPLFSTILTRTHNQKAMHTYTCTHKHAHTHKLMHTSQYTWLLEEAVDCLVQHYMITILTVSIISLILYIHMTYSCNVMTTHYISVQNCILTTHLELMAHPSCAWTLAVESISMCIYTTTKRSTYAGNRRDCHYLCTVMCYLRVACGQTDRHMCITEYKIVVLVMYI